MGERGHGRRDALQDELSIFRADRRSPGSCRRVS